MRDQFSTLRWKTRRLDLLCHSTVLEDAFRIGHDGFLGTVNGMRLGRLPSVPVDWAEINCAWGYVALLLNGIAKALPGIQFNTSLVLVGNTSYVLSSDRGMLNLFNDGSKLFGTRRLDDAVSELLKVVMRMSEYCSRYDKNFFFPYVIGSDKVGKFPVRYQAKDDVGWSEAMKSLLTDIKFIVSWVVPKMNTKIQIK